MKKLKHLLKSYQKHNLNLGILKPISFWATLLAAMLTRYLYFGPRYFPVVDDNNMYGVFSLKSPFYVLDHYKMYTTRPFAAILDTFVFSLFWNNMFILLCIMILLHFFCCVLLWKIFVMNNFKFGNIAAIFLGMLPYGTEATYWISASSRIVVGLFFALLSMYILMLNIHSTEIKDKRFSLEYILIFFITNLVSLGFYEQIIVISFFGCLVLFVFNFKRIGNKLILLIPFINLAIVLAFYKHFSNSGNMAERGQIVKDKYITHTFSVLKQIRQHLQYNQIKMYTHGLVKGIHIVIENKSILFILLAIIISIFVAYLCKKEEYDTSLKANSIKFTLGIFLTILPYTPFFLLDSTWMASRNSFLSLLGLALILEATINLILRGKYLSLLRGISVGVIVLCFILINTAEINDYRTIYKTDNKIISEFVNNTNKLNVKLDQSSTVIIFNTVKTYINPIGDNIWSCTGTYWAFMGALEARTRNTLVPTIFPARNNTTFSLPKGNFYSAVFFGMDNENLKLFPLSSKWKSTNTLELFLQDGTTYGNVSLRPKNRYSFKLEHK